MRHTYRPVSRAPAKIAQRGTGLGLPGYFFFLRPADSLNPASEDLLMMKPSTDGQLFAKQPALLPIMLSCLQAAVHRDGYADLTVWRAGSFGRVRFSPIKGAYTWETRPFRGLEKPGNASTQSLIDPHCEGDGAILLEFGKAEATVETPGAFVVWVDPEMHGSDPVVSKRLKLRGDHPAPPTACLKSGKDVDMEMRGILVLKPSRSAARILNSFHHVGVARTGGCQSRNLLADERPPVRLQVSVEPAGVRHPYNVADWPVVLNENKGKVFGEFEVGYRPDVAGQMRVAIKRAGILTAIGGFQADVEKGVDIRFNRGADEAAGVHHFATSSVALCLFRSREERMH